MESNIRFLPTTYPEARKRKKAPGFATKRTIKYIAIAPNEKARSEAIRQASPAVIKSLSDIALNAARGDVKFTRTQKRELRKHRQHIEQLIDNRIPLEKKRRLLTQKGSGLGAILGLIIPTVVSAIGSAIMNRNN